MKKLWIALNKIFVVLYFLAMGMGAIFFWDKLDELRDNNKEIKIEKTNRSN